MLQKSEAFNLLKFDKIKLLILMRHIFQDDKEISKYLHNTASNL